MRSSDAQWLWPSLTLTVVVGLLSTALMFVVKFTNSPNPLFSLASWFGWMVMASGAAIIIYTIRLMIAGEEKPLAMLASNLRSHWARYAAILMGAALGGFDMYFFMTLKPELDVLFPFWADTHLADLDHWIFGTDPWRLFAGLDLVTMSWVYSPFWFFSMLLTFFWLLLRPASETKAVAIIAYFATWSVFGPIGQAFFSSGGPIFYERLGLGDRFTQLPVPALSQALAEYLWSAYQGRSLAPGAGISAMPSLHIATMAWVTITFAMYRSRWTIPAAILSLFIYAGSVALGWHYATDGLVGALGAGLCFYGARIYLVRSRRDTPLYADAVRT